MRPGKRSRNAKTREKLKKQRIDPDVDANDGSCYAPSEAETDSESGDDASVDTSRKQKTQPGAASEDLRGALCALVEPEPYDLSDSESDGEIMLGDQDALDENDWDPGFLPDLYPIFTQPVSNKNNDGGGYVDHLDR
ncbi:hypothetical protein RSAG8_09797, partial [Rhizoctonia solani AG-8 WAC10335]